MGRFLATLRALRPVQLRLACWDRIVLRGYPRLQRPENIVHFFPDVCGDARITPAVSAQRTSSYRRWLESFAESRTTPRSARSIRVYPHAAFRAGSAP